jgi:hypothetical protein
MRRRRMPPKPQPEPITLAWPALVRCAATASLGRKTLEQVWIEEHDGGRLYVATNSYLMLTVWDGGARPALDAEPISAAGVALNTVTRRCSPTAITFLDGAAVIDDASGTKITTEAPTEFAKWRKIASGYTYDRAHRMPAFGLATMPDLLFVAKRICERDRAGLAFSPGANELQAVQVEFVRARVPATAWVMPIREDS